MPLSVHRQPLLDLLHEAKGPLSADEIRLTLGHRKIGQATVYRLLRQGVDEGDLREVSFPDSPKRYELLGSDHRHYFLCTECDRAFDVEGCLGKISTMAPKGFEVSDHDIVLRGRCADCVKAAS